MIYNSPETIFHLTGEVVLYIASLIRKKTGSIKDVERELCQITGQTMIKNIKVLRTGIYTIYLNAKRTPFAS